MFLLFAQGSSVSKEVLRMRGEIEKLKYLMEVIDYLIIKRLSGIRKLKYPIYIWERNIENLKVSLRYESYAPRISHPCLNSSSQTEIKFIYCMYLIENGWSKTPPHDPHHNDKYEKKRFWATPFILAFSAPAFWEKPDESLKLDKLLRHASKKITHKFQRNHRVDPLL